MKGYKVFKPDWTCKGFQYRINQIYEINEAPICCRKGFHFCKKASDCFNYYSFDSSNKVAEIEALGEIDTDGIKSCTNKIRIVREIPWGELLDIVNTGKSCTGLCNTGDWNSGDYNSGNRNTGKCNTGNCNTEDWNSGNWNTGNCNTGDWDSGDCNTGDWNSGDYNSGNRNTGNRNSGNRNTGNRNTGNRNTGNRNTGDWNKSSFNNGCFMTIEPKIMMFNDPSEWTYRDWLNSDARYLLDQIQKNVLKWICSSDMTDAEKEAHPEHEITGGYLKKLDESACGQLWWNGLTNAEKDIIRSMPNFDKNIFEEITGIATDGKEEKESEE